MVADGLYCSLDRSKTSAFLKHTKTMFLDGTGVKPMYRSGPPQRTDPPWLGRKVVALSLLSIGAMTTCNMFLPRVQRIGPDWFRGAFVLLGPVLLASGVVLSVLELVAWRRSDPAKAARGDTSPGWVLWLGLTMLLIGGIPWAYTRLIFGSANEEAWGMIGTIIFLFIGLPGLAVTGIGVSRMREHRRRQAELKDLDGT